ncbi:hypothetical protein E0Z10_g6534 [Xylaria hypoxylon]|uniref:Hemerythrin-like domain-containing protein n=1 Tax=Xylaria hypoxylon TaxID=37992 RepID=A0A4Z0Z0P5_9PEZI|nr:hypothetical protein E0Z10_g6534 [Xylaria hypoxylon]
MASLIKPRPGDRGLLAVKPSSPRAAASGGYRQASESGSGSGSGSQDGKAKGEIVVMKPWADQPWPLIESPSRIQHITHPALHIANEIADIHNAMLRGLNSIYLQAPHVQQARDIADLLFLTQSWSTWLLDHHHLKESVMLPGFEAVLGVPAGTLALPSIQGPSAASSSSDRDITTTTTTTTKRKDKEAYGEEEETVSFLLHRVYAYASATHKDPQAYNATTLEGLLVALGDTLVPHFTRQVGLLASMREMCSGSLPAANTKRDGEIPGRLPLPMVTITRTASDTAPPSTPPSTSPPASPSSSTFSGASASGTSASSPAHSPPTASLSLFPSTSARPQHHKISNSVSSGSSGESNRTKTNGPDPGVRTLDVIDREAKDKLARARALLEADDRINKLMQVYTTADTHAAVSIDHFVIPPMIVRLRDSTASSSPALSRTASSMSLSSSSSFGSRKGSKSMGMGMGMGGNGGVGGGNKGDWPRMSVPAIHAIADKLSPRHEGAWRFLPCDVWGRPRELPFLGL